MRVNLDKTRAQDVDLAAILDGVDQATIVLPEFQRDFVWGVEDVRQLLATVLAGWPMGSLLLMQGPTTLFGTRTFDAVSGRPDSPRYVVLDGQQRLTSLYHALYGRGAVRYALRYELLESPNIEVLDDAIESFRAHHWQRLYPDAAAALAAGLIPATALRSAADFFEWRDNALPLGEGRPELSQRLTDLYRDFLSGVHRYDVPAVIIDSSIDPSAIARIFERVNRTGMSLGTFDLVVAHSFTAEFNLREKWLEAREQWPILNEFFEGEGLPILGLIALRARNDLRQSAILALTGEEVRDYWLLAVTSMRSAVEYARTNFGAVTVSWTPNQYMISILGALAMEFDLATMNDVLPAWYWTTGFSGTYEVASNTRAVTDYRRLSGRRWSPPRAIVLVRDQMLQATRKVDAGFHRTFLSLMLANGAKSLIDGEPLELRAGAVRSESLFSRGEAVEALDPPPHLRTLSLVLRKDEERPATIRRAARSVDRDIALSQLLPGSPVQPTSAYFAERLSVVISAIEARSSLTVRLVTEEEADATSRGMAKFMGLLDALNRQGRHDLAEAVEFVQWHDDRQEIVVAFATEGLAGHFIGRDGHRVRDLAAELPLRRIHVEVDPEL